MKKKLFTLLLSAALLAGCTTGTPSKKKKKNTSSEEEVVNRVTNVTLNRSELNFNLNTEHQYTVETLIATVEGEGEYDSSLTWLSTNENVATIDDGVVHALSIGSATITAVSNSDEDKYATCSVTVINDIPVIESVSISPTQPTIDLYVESFVQLTATVHGTNSPSQQVNWSATSSGNVLSVDQNGKVTATKTGTGTVTATSAKDTSKSASVTVTVVDSTPRVTSVEIQPTAASYTLDLYEPNNKKTQQFTANVTVTNGASQEVSWSSSDPNKVSVSDTGLVTALQTTVSQVTITATSKFDTSKTDTVKITVVDNTPRVSSVVVSVNSSVKVGATTNATATVSGTNLTTAQKTVTWTSSNTAIAEINATTGVITGKTAGGPVTITATSTFDNTKSGTATITVVEAGVQDAYTVMLYLCGADLESSNGYGTEDIKEILQAGAPVDGVNFIVETGGASSWKSSSSNYTSNGQRIPANLTRWFVNSNAKLEKVTNQPSDTSMATKATFKSFLEWGLTDYPAEKTAVILWDHGGGMEGCCLDERNGSSYLTPSDLYAGLKEVLGTGSNARKLEWIGYDCCTMQMADIASTNADYFHYQIASQELEAGEGWVYTNWVSQLYNSVKNNTNLATGDLLKVICDDFVAAGGSDSDNDQVLSYVKLDNMPTFTDAFNEFTSGYNNQTSYNNVVTAAGKVLRFAEYAYYRQSVGDVDMRPLLVQLGAAETSAVVKAFDNLIGYHAYYKNASVYKTNKPTGLNAFVAFEPSGYTITVPKDAYNCTSSVYSTKFETWCNMNRNYGTFYSSSGGWW